ncbi:hypothetical protein [Marinilactibacillus piezotolerans]|uniref:hypothetical protein n=1 Tax=Marinilactibacillus piezotolerans TaxID=258723 RepID=UPI0009B14623|nr:hypothetical protein [Marinilactibacillus piezotolerans]
MLVLLIRFFLLTIIFIGYYQVATVYFKVKEEFSPVVICSVLGIIVFISGLLNLLIESVIILSIVSLLSLIYIIWQKKLNLSFPVGLIYFVAMTVYFVLLLRGKSLAHYDDFSHWGLVTREIVNSNQFPSNSSDLIIFKSYPTGSASFIYFIAKTLGNTEGVFLFAQSILVSASITTLFSLVKENRIVKSIVIIIATVFFLTAYNSPFVLLVDTILPLIGIAATCIVIFYSTEKNISKGFYTVLPILTYLVTVKNSSLFFVVIVSLLIVYYSFINREPLKNILLYIIASIGVPFTINYLWSKHVAFTFPTGLETKHSFSLENYRNVFDGKTSQDIKEITDLFINKMITLSNVDVKILVFIFSFIVIFNGIRALQGQKSKRLFSWKIIVALLAVYSLYQLALWAMYVLSMPLDEALILAAYSRYSFTIVIYLFGVGLIYLLKATQETQSRTKANFITLILLFTFVVTPILIREKYTEVFNLVQLEHKETPVRRYFNDALSDQPYIPGEKYTIYISDNEALKSSGALRYIARYELRSSDIKILDNQTVDQSIIGEDRYLLILENDQKLTEILETSFEDKELDSLIFLNK